MDLRHKHWAVIAVGILVAAFAVLAAYYLLGSTTVVAPGLETATTTPETASAGPAAPLHLTEHAAYYDIDLSYPSATPLASLSAEANAQAVAAMKASMQEIADSFKKNGNFENLTPEDVKLMRLDERKEALSSEYKAYAGTRTVSYVFTIYEDTLGAHPNTYFRTFTFDTKTGMKLELGNLFLPSANYLSVLSQRARTDLPAIIKRMSGSDADIAYIQEGTKPLAESFQNFYIDGSNLVLLFPPYQVGPYALGTVIDPVPLARLASVKAEYR